MAMTIVNQSETGITYTLFAAYGSGVGSGAPGSGVGSSKGSGVGSSKGSGVGSSKGSGTKERASGVAPSGVQASGASSYTVAHDWMQAPGHTLSVSGG